MVCCFRPEIHLSEIEIIDKKYSDNNQRLESLLQSIDLKLTNLCQKNSCENNGTSKKLEFNERLKLENPMENLQTTSRVLIIGCGDSGNNIIDREFTMGVSGAETIAINTDRRHLEMIVADKRILIGVSH